MVPVDHIVNSVPCKVQNEKFEVLENIKIEQNKYWANHIDCRLPENFCLQTIAYSFFFYYKPVSKQNLDKSCKIG